MAPEDNELKQSDIEDESLDLEEGRGDRRERFTFTKECPDLVAYMIAVRTELLMRVVMPAVVPHSAEAPYMAMARFETGPGGNPHWHGFGMGCPGPRVGRVEADVEAGMKDVKMFLMGTRAMKTKRPEKIPVRHVIKELVQARMWRGWVLFSLVFVCAAAPPPAPASSAGSRRCRRGHHCAVTCVDGIPVSTGKIGPLAGRLSKIYFDIATGAVEDTRGWLTAV